MAANIIINGGTRGIGLAIVKLLATDPGNKIVVTGRNSKVLDQLGKECFNVKTYSLDITSFSTEKESFIEYVSSYFQEINVVINTTGYLISKDFLDMESVDARRIMETNFFGPAFMIKSLMPLLINGSHIVNISSMGGFQGSVKFRGLSWYSASKAAIACLTECLANEFSDSGVKVNCLALGAVQTEMLHEAFPGYKAPLEADEMAEFIVDFALKGHRFFNGKILPVALSTP